MGRKIGVQLVSVLGAMLALAGEGRAADIRVAGDPRPAILDSIPTPAGLQAVALEPDGSRVALAELEPDRERSVITIHSPSGDESVRVAGLVRALLFDPGGTSLYAIRFRSAKKRPGDAELLRIEPGDGRPRSVMRLPSSASALDYWAAQRSLLVAGANEIRTVILDGLRSGPLFRVPGPNVAIASLASSNLVLLGQQTRLLLLDLADPHGEESMPVRASVETPAAISSLAAAPDGTTALCRLQDGRVLRITFAPLGLDAAGTADAIVAAGKTDATAPVPVPPLATVPPPGSERADVVGSPGVETGADERGAPPASPPAAEPAAGGSREETPSRAGPSSPSASAALAGQEPEAPVAPGEAVTPDATVPTAEGPSAPGASPGGEAAGSPAPSGAAAAPGAPPKPPNAPSTGAVQAPAATVEPPSESTEPSSAGAVEPRSASGGAEPLTGGAPQLSGKIEGPARDAVVEVVLLGPDNLLREALRVRPDPDGTWRASGLAPGRYQIQLAGGADRVLVSEPSAVIAVVTPGESVEAQSFRVLRAFRP